MQLLPADYVLLGLTVLLMALGLWRGVSETFAMLAGGSLAAASVFFGWGGFLGEISPTWVAIVISVAFFILVFGCVRAVVKFVIGKLLSQPADSIFGVCLGLFCGLALLWGASRRPMLRDWSNLAQYVAVTFQSAGSAYVR